MKGSAVVLGGKKVRKSVLAILTKEVGLVSVSARSKLATDRLGAAFYQTSRLWLGFFSGFCCNFCTVLIQHVWPEVRLFREARAEVMCLLTSPSFAFLSLISAASPRFRCKRTESARKAGEAVARVR